MTGLAKEECFKASARRECLLAKGIYLRARLLEAVRWMRLAETQNVRIAVDILLRTNPLIS